MSGAGWLRSYMAYVLVGFAFRCLIEMQLYGQLLNEHLLFHERALGMAVYLPALLTGISVTYNGIHAVSIGTAHSQSVPESECQTLDSSRSRLLP